MFSFMTLLHVRKLKRIVERNPEAQYLLFLLVPVAFSFAPVPPKVAESSCDP